MILLKCAKYHLCSNNFEYKSMFSVLYGKPLLKIHQLKELLERRSKQQQSI